MDIILLLSLLNYGLVLLFGLFLSVLIAGGWQTARQKRAVIVLAPLLLLLQSCSAYFWGLDITEQLYPVLVHLPLILGLTLILKKSLLMSLVSVCTAYLCCQLPNWISLTIRGFTDNALIPEIGYLVCIGPFFYLLYRFFVKPAHSVMTDSRQSLLLFGSLPVAYYLFDYATAVYTQQIKMDTEQLLEFLPTALILFYVVFLAAYHQLSHKRAQAELRHTVLETQLHQSEAEMKNLRAAQAQAAFYRHDIRHHMNILHGFLAVGNLAQAQQYIQEVNADIEAFSPRRFCENETVNLICSSYLDKAAASGIALTVNAQLPAGLTVSDSELCSVLSNGLENALHAVNDPAVTEKQVRIYCHLKRDKLLLEITNPYAGTVEMMDGLPVSGQKGHGYGCSSILSIVRRHNGLCSFEAENGIFTLRVVLPNINTGADAK